jgi:hypothetical protein
MAGFTIGFIFVNSAFLLDEHKLFALFPCKTQAHEPPFTGKRSED